VRAVVAALQPFEPTDQERILRWAREKLGLSATSASGAIKDLSSEAIAAEPSVPAAPTKSTDIKTFIEYKKPQTDNQFAAAVAYYYRFEAPPSQRKDAITKSLSENIKRDYKVFGA
jgi:hypothetical protein